MKHSTDIRIYYEDTDAGGIVYHSNYLKFGERSRTEFLRSLGYSNSVLKSTQRILYVVKHIDIEYHKPAFLDDLLRMDASIEEIRNTSFIMKQTAFRPSSTEASSQEDELIADMRVVLVCIDAQTLKPIRFPDEMKEQFKQFTQAE